MTLKVALVNDYFLVVAGLRALLEPYPERVQVGEIVVGAPVMTDFEPPEPVAGATLEAILDGSLTVVRGGQERRDMIATNREDPASVDQMLAERKPLLERAVEEHSSI